MINRAILSSAAAPSIYNIYGTCWNYIRNTADCSSFIPLTQSCSPFFVTENGSFPKNIILVELTLEWNSFVQSFERKRDMFPCEHGPMSCKLYTVAFSKDGILWNDYRDPSTQERGLTIIDTWLLLYLSRKHCKWNTFLKIIIFRKP